MLLLLLLMNVIGYYGVFVGLGIRNDSLMTQRLDLEKYTKSEIITIKIPITVPYARDEEDYQRVDGKFEYHGEFFRLVKQRFSKDTLTVICVKDRSEKKIQEALFSYVKTFADNQASDNSNSKFKISFIKDYIIHSINRQKYSDGLELEVVHQGSLVNFISSFSASIIHPPERG